MRQIEFKKPERHEKAWGYEDWICNYEEFGYCGKILHFKKDSKFSMHFHKYKHETWFVLNGKLTLFYIDPSNAQQHNRSLIPGDVIVIPECCPHQLIATSEADVLEFSTLHLEHDSYRVAKGDSQF